MTGSHARRRAILTVLVLVTVACLGAAAAVVLIRGAGDDPTDIGGKIQSLRDDRAPAADVTKDREQLLALSREFATRFNTYDASMLDEAGHLPEYASIDELMTAKFGGIFAENVGFAEQTVAQLDAASVANVYAVGVASQDADSAEVLVAGTIELTYPYPEDEGKGGDGQADDQTDEQGADGEDAPRVSTGPQRFRYQVSLVKIDGTWLVDDLDDIDDGLPPFSQPGIPGEEPTTPGVDPSDPATPEDQATEESTEQSTEQSTGGATDGATEQSTDEESGR